MTYSYQYILQGLLFLILGTFAFLLAKLKTQSFKNEFLLGSLGFLTISSSYLYAHLRDLDVIYYGINLLGVVLIGVFLFRITTQAIGKLERLAFFDPLTGVYNRRFIEEYIKEELKKGKRLKNEFSVILIDLNDFKLVNDMLGHSEGDKVLKKVAHALRCNLREYDLIARWGGDEFIVVLPMVGMEEVLEVVSKLSENIKVKHKDVLVTLSVGYSCYPFDGRTMEELINVADSRMYRAKSIFKEVKKHGVEDPG